MWGLGMAKKKTPGSGASPYEPILSRGYALPEKRQRKYPCELLTPRMHSHCFRSLQYRKHIIGDIVISTGSPRVVAGLLCRCLIVSGHPVSQDGCDQLISGPSQKTVTYPLIVDDMRKLLDELQVDKVFLCGYSTGGSIVLEFLLTYPERAFGSILVGAMSEVHDFRLTTRISLGATCARLAALKPLALSVTWSNFDNLKLFWKAFQDARKGTSKNVEEYYRSSLKYNCTA